MNSQGRERSLAHQPSPRRLGGRRAFIHGDIGDHIIVVVAQSLLVRGGRVSGRGGALGELKDNGGEAAAGDVDFLIVRDLAYGSCTLPLEIDFYVRDADSLTIRLQSPVAKRL